MRLTKDQNKKINQYIIDCIDLEPYDITANTDKEKLQQLAHCFNLEYGFHIDRMGYNKAMSEWFQGLPTIFGIDFTNYEILKLAKEWGSIPQDATELQENKIISRWFDFIAHKTIMLMNKNQINKGV